MREQPPYSSSGVSASDLLAWDRDRHGLSQVWLERISRRRCSRGCVAFGLTQNGRGKRKEGRHEAESGVETDACC